MDPRFRRLSFLFVFCLVFLLSCGWVGLCRLAFCLELSYLVFFVVFVLSCLALRLALYFVVLSSSSSCVLLSCVEWRCVVSSCLVWSCLCLLPFAFVFVLLTSVRIVF